MNRRGFLGGAIAAYLAWFGISRGLAEEIDYWLAANRVWDSYDKFSDDGREQFCQEIVHDWLQYGIAKVGRIPCKYGNSNGIIKCWEQPYVLSLRYTVPKPPSLGFPEGSYEVTVDKNDGKLQIFGNCFRCKVSTSFPASRVDSVRPVAFLDKEERVRR